MSKVIKVIQATHLRDDYAEIEDETPFRGDIYPENEEQLKRPIKLGRASQVNGCVFGRVVEMKDGLSQDQMTTALSIYGEEEVRVYDFCRIAGFLQSNGRISVGKNCMIIGDIVGQRIEISDNTVVGGNIIAYGDILLGNNVEIGGYVISRNGSIAIGDNTKIFDVFASGSIEMGENIFVTDPVLFSGDKIEFSKIMIAMVKPISSGDHEFIKQNEINPYYTASSVCNLNQIFSKLVEQLRALNE
jgi:predicted acyltransferase (DUF342 family)